MQKLLYFISLMWIYHIFFFKLTALHFAALSIYIQFLDGFYPKKVILTHLGDWSEPELLLYIPLLYYTNLPVHVYICV